MPLYSAKSTNYAGQEISAAFHHANRAYYIVTSSALSHTSTLPKLCSRIPRLNTAKRAPDTSKAQYPSIIRGNKNMSRRK